MGSSTTPPLKSKRFYSTKTDKEGESKDETRGTPLSVRRAFGGVFDVLISFVRCPVEAEKERITEAVWKLRLRQNGDRDL